MAELSVGDIVRSAHYAGKFKVIKVRADGDIEVYGGTGGYENASHITGHASFRTFPADQVRAG